MNRTFHENSRRKVWVIGESSGLQGEQITGNLNINFLNILNQAMWNLFLWRNNLKRAKVYDKRLHNSKKVGYRGWYSKKILWINGNRITSSYWRFEPTKRGYCLSFFFFFLPVLYLNISSRWSTPSRKV